MTTTARRIRVHGKVQGVFYRGWTVDEARALGLDGWVRNRLDGSVEIVAVGSAEAVDTLDARCHEGPPAARVDRVDVEETPGIVAQGFTQKPTV
jgi:acylphosphatase